MKLLHFGKLGGGTILQPKVMGCRVAAYLRNKPAGENIIWTSPVDSSYGWKERWLSEGVSLEELDEIPQEKRWVLELDEGGSGCQGR